jgi:hypothetical protein
MALAAVSQLCLQQFDRPFVAKKAPIFGHSAILSLRWFTVS